MHGAFSVVLWAVCGLGIVAAVITVLGSGKAWEAYTSKGMLMESTQTGPNAVSANSLEAERTDEIRQMLEAANARRQRRGEPPLDVDAELSRLMADERAASIAAGVVPAVDPEVEAEVRALVAFQNGRRERRGEAPLDVDAEVARRLAEIAQTG